MGIVNVEGLLEPISGNAMENVEWCPTDIDASSSSKSSFVASVDWGCRERHQTKKPRQQEYVITAVN